jgi:XTP/dITP diphosphohydrolase
MSSASNRVKLLVATTNAGKVREIGRALAGLPFEVVSLADVLPNASYRERGRTFLDNARGKSRRYARLSGFLTVAEDSGLEVEALGGAPGVHSARFARPDPTDERNLHKVLRLLRDVPRPKRRARFVCALVLSRPDGVVGEVLGEVRGIIAEDTKGSNGFGYDPIFYYPRLGKRFAELTPEAKNTVSHRGRALEKMIKILQRVKVER